MGNTRPCGFQILGTKSNAPQGEPDWELVGNVCDLIHASRMFDQVLKSGKWERVRLTHTTVISEREGKK